MVPSSPRWAEGPPTLHLPWNLWHRDGSHRTGGDWKHLHCRPGLQTMEQNQSFPRGGTPGDDVVGHRSYKYVGILERAKAAGCWDVSPFLLSTHPVTQGSRLRCLRCAPARLQTPPPALGRLRTTLLRNRFGPASSSKEPKLSG